MTTVIGAIGGGRDADTVSITRGASETWQPMADAGVAESGSGVDRLRLMVGERTVLGALLIGDQTLSGLLQDMVASKADISAIRGRLLQPDQSPQRVLANFWAEGGSHAAQ